ncbi:hypothetical protein [Streptomyces sp. NPDC051994]|uniref:hypothetical protein n=1 Tax=unclassified Streptomyces TaxID=2593676 RepID=UPI003449784F
MPDEPTNAELGRLIVSLQGEMHRRLDVLNTRLTEFVPQNVYAVQTQYVGERLAYLQSEAQKARDGCEALEDAFEQYQRDERDRRERERQARLYQLTVPVLLAVMSAAIAIWAVVSK